MIYIIDYGVGNLGSVQKALTALGYKAVISKNIKEIKAAQCLILPGQGAFATAMANLKKLDLISFLQD